MVGGGKKHFNFDYFFFLKILEFLFMVNVLKFQTLVAYQKGQTQIRLLLKKQPDQGCPCFLF